MALFGTQRRKSVLHAPPVFLRCSMHVFKIPFRVGAYPKFFIIIFSFEVEKKLPLHSRRSKLRHRWQRVLVSDQICFICSSLPFFFILGCFSMGRIYVKTENTGKAALNQFCQLDLTVKGWIVCSFIIISRISHQVLRDSLLLFLERRRVGDIWILSFHEIFWKRSAGK